MFGVLEGGEERKQDGGVHDALAQIGREHKDVVFPRGVGEFERQQDAVAQGHEDAADADEVG